MRHTSMRTHTPFFDYCKKKKRNRIEEIFMSDMIGEEVGVELDR